MKSLLPLAVLLAVGIVGCSKSDPYAKYRDVQLKRGMKIADIKQQFGEPDRYRSGWSISPGGGIASDEPRKDYPYRREYLGYGAFGAHDQEKGHVTKYRLDMTFVDGELYTWEKSTPSNRQ